jgi:hypothetical protein
MAMNKLLLAIALGFLLALSGFGQQTERMIDFPANQAPGNLVAGEKGRLVPTDLKGLQLVAISVAGKTVTPGQFFTAADDWLKTLKVKLKNVSGKTLLSVRMSFSLPEAQTNNAGLGLSLAFGSLNTRVFKQPDQAVPDGEEFELVETEDGYNADRNFRISRTGIDNITQLVSALVAVKVDDGSLLMANLKPETVIRNTPK